MLALFPVFCMSSYIIIASFLGLHGLPVNAGYGLVADSMVFMEPPFQLNLPHPPTVVMRAVSMPSFMSM